MSVRQRWCALGRNDTVRAFLFGLGALLIVITPAVAILPGPGGVFTLAAGLALMLKNSRWAKKRYVAFKRRWPHYGHWTDWGLRRESARRRKEIARLQAEPAEAASD